MQVIAGGSRRRIESGDSEKDSERTLYPEGETETFETKVVSNGVEGVHVDADGE